MNQLKNIAKEADDDASETLNVYDATLIWASNGKDEDYTFGYSKAKLEDALKQIQYKKPPQSELRPKS